MANRLLNIENTRKFGTSLSACNGTRGYEIILLDQSLSWQRRRYRSWRQTWFATGMGAGKVFCQELVEKSRVQAEDGRMARHPVPAIDHKLDVRQLLEGIGTAAHVAVIDMHQNFPVFMLFLLRHIMKLKDCKVSQWIVKRQLKTLNAESEIAGIGHTPIPSILRYTLSGGSHGDSEDTID